MLTPSLIHVAIFVYFSVSSGHGIDFASHVGNTPAAKVEGTVVLGGSSFREKLGLDLEPVTRPDKEIAAFQSSVSGLKSVPAFNEQIATQSPEKLTTVSRKKRFELLCDEQGGFYLNGVFYPGPDGKLCPQQPVKCVLFSPTEHDADGSQRLVFKASFGGRDPSEFPEANPQIFSFYTSFPH
ncbi:MAG: hypothetical protein ABSG53_04485 [Thermoguttaceae bacterium]|jgi:hypothetical protein